VAQGASRASGVGEHDFAEDVSEADTPAVLQSEDTSMNHYLAKKLGRTMTKHELINDPPPMSLDDYVSVSKLAMCFQVAIALSAPQLTPYVHFSGSPLVGR
jgi:hypothetical protein